MTRFGTHAAALCAAVLALAPHLSWAEPPTPSELAREEAFLKIPPEIDVPADVQPIPGAVNEPWRDCQPSWPPEYLRTQEGPEARAYRDIYGFVRAEAVIAQQECGCETKIADWSLVEQIALRLRDSTGTRTLSWVQTREVSDRADKLIAVAEVMCGGQF